MFKNIRKIKKKFRYGLQHHLPDTKIVEEKLCKIRRFNYMKRKSIEISKLSKKNVYNIIL